MRILNSVMTYGNENLIKIGALLIVIGLIILLWAVITRVVGWAPLIICAVLAVVGGGVMIYGNNQEDGNLYEAIIENDDGYKEILEKFDIIEQKGEIWVLKDKKETEETVE